MYGDGYITEGQDGIQYRPGSGDDGYISLGWDGEWVPATLANLNKFTEGHFDCYKAFEHLEVDRNYIEWSKKAKNNPSILQCVWMYNMIMLEQQQK